MPSKTFNIFYTGKVLLSHYSRNGNGEFMSHFTDDDNSRTIDLENNILAIKKINKKNTLSISATYNYFRNRANENFSADSLTLAVIANSLKDTLLGCIPFGIGDLIDFFYKSNVKNLKLITGYVNDDKEIIHKVDKMAFWLVVFIIILCVLIYFMVKFAIWFVQWLISLIGSLF